MFSNILVAVDMSAQSDRAVLAARELASLSGGKVRLVHVSEHEVFPSVGGVSYDVEDPDNVEALLRENQAMFAEAGVAVTTEIRHAMLGHAAAEIMAAAHQSEADLIVMGCHGRGAIGHLLLGSNTYKLLHLCDRPVLVVR